MAFPGVGAIAHIRSLCEPAVRKTLEVHQPCQLRFLRMRFWANGTTRDHDPVASLCLLRNLWDGAAARISTSCSMMWLWTCA
jgi:hypothetical protein